MKMSVGICRVLIVCLAVLISMDNTILSVRGTSEDIYSMHFPDVSSLPCPLVDDVRLYDSVTRTYNSILQTARAPSSDIYSKLKAMNCLAGTDFYHLDAHILLAYTFFEAGLFQGAVSNAVTALSRNPQSPVCLNILQEAYFRLGELRRARFYSEYLHNVFPDHQNMFYDGNRLEHLRNAFYKSDPIKAKTNDFENYMRRISRSMSTGGLLIDVIDAELYLDSVLSQPVDSSGHGSIFDEARHECRALFQEDIRGPHFAAVDDNSKWPATAPIKIFSLNSKAFQVAFSESILALSGMLSEFAIPHEIVSDISTSMDPDADHSLYIFLHGTPYSNLLHRLPKNYIFWNFEKHPIVIDDDLDGYIAASGGPYVGFKLDDVTGVETVSYPLSFIRGAMAIWEASISNFAHWERALSTRGTCQPIASDLEWPKVVWVPPITPLPDIEKTCVSVIGKPRSSRIELMRELDFGNFKSCQDPFPGIIGSSQLPSHPMSCSRLQNAEKPIDVLFYGDTSLHRQETINELVQVAKERGWEIRHFLRYNLVGSVREAAIDQAKVVINLNSLASSPIEGDPHFTREPAVALNTHRIRYLLGKGKAVVSERAGYKIEENQFGDVVVFVDTIDDLIEEIDNLIADDHRRSSLENKAIAFSAKQFVATRAKTAGSILSFNIAQLLEDNPAAGMKSHGCVGGSIPMEEKLQAIQEEVRSEGATSTFYPSANDLVSHAFSMAQSLYFLPCVSDSPQRDDNLCRKRSFSMKYSDLNTQAPTKSDQICRFGTNTCVSTSERFELAELSLGWAHWKAVEHRLNSAFVYAFPSPHYAALISSKDEFGGLRVSSHEGWTGRGSVSSARNYIDIPLLLGYLQRRFAYAGRYLRVGCTATVEKNMYLSIHDNSASSMSGFAECLCVEDVGDAGPLTYMKNEAAAISLQLPNGEANRTHGYFDLIYIDGVHESETVYLQVKAAIDLLDNDGTIVISNARPRFKEEASFPSDGSFFWSGNVWKAVLRISELEHVDVALADFEWGVAIVRKRPNRFRRPTDRFTSTNKPDGAVPDTPDFSPKSAFHGISYGSVSWQTYVGQTDQFLPVLSFTALHYWLF